MSGKFLDMYMDSIRIDGEPSGSMRVVPNWNKFGDMIVRNCIFELVHESTLQSNKEVQDFTVRVAERIKTKFGIE